jgi:pimeloyl-ACP methyl ester carboxylesterase
MYFYWLRGHGNSKSLKTAFKQNYTFSALANDILEVLDFLKIEKSHFVEFRWVRFLLGN